MFNSPAALVFCLIMSAINFVCLGNSIYATIFIHKDLLAGLIVSIANAMTVYMALYWYQEASEISACIQQDDSSTSTTGL